MSPLQGNSKEAFKENEQNEEKFEALLDYLKHNRGLDFTGYKRQSLLRRIRRRMQIVGISDFEDYQDYLEIHPGEFSELFNTILINVTSFFRDKGAWDYLAKEIIPRIITSKKEDEVIRIWSAGCATGEEAYTIAMLMIEALGEEAFKDRIKIFATDIDDAALAQARQASYTMKDIEAVPPEMKDKYFQIQGGAYVFRPDLRRSVIFGRHNLIQDAPISHLDLLICRNTLMYFNAETQAKILARFHFALSDSGHLFLGRAELLLTHSNLFTPVNLKCRIFTKVSKANIRDKLMVLAQAGDYEATNQLTRQVRLREISFDNAPIAQIAVDPNCNLVLANNKARMLLGLDLRDIGRPLRDLEASYRPVELRSLISQAYSERKTVTANKIKKQISQGDAIYLDVQVVPFSDNRGNLLGADISFSTMTDYYRLQDELEHSKHNLETAYDELQSANGELETTNEELQSTIDELETTNEELQSTNEELETMNEELQSANEELRQNTDELNRTNSFLESVFASIHKGVAALDNNGMILAWNREAEDLWGLRSDKVLGQSITHLDIGLPREKLTDTIKDTIENGRSNELTLRAKDIRGNNIDVHVTLSPLVGREKERNGIMMLMERLLEKQ